MSDGYICLGQWKNGLPHGKASITFPNGDIYVGNMAVGEKSGKGILKQVSGYSYEGGWMNNRRHGDGISTE